MSPRMGQPIALASASRLSIPGPGLALSAVTEQRATHIRQAVSIIRQSMQAHKYAELFAGMFGPRWTTPEFAQSGDPLDRAAWAIVTTRVVGRLVGAIPNTASLRDAENWFIGARQRELGSLASVVPENYDREACRVLDELTYDDGLSDLLPYALEFHGPGSRASVMRDPGTRHARAAKRMQGVFYTPSDVAEYMARTVLHDCAYPGFLPRCIDTACGTGVFLRAIMACVLPSPNRRLEFAINSLYGIDICEYSIEATCFVLLHDCLKGAPTSDLAPWSMWHAIRMNFAAIDATLVARTEESPAALSRERDRLRQLVLQGASVPPAPPGPDASVVAASRPLFGYAAIQLSSLFPEVDEGFDVLIGNPPYAPIGEQRDADFFSAEYACLASGARPTDDLYPLFIEMMWRFTRPGRSASALVLPLSIAYHRGRQFAACRHAMMQRGGLWRFAFFDREPHALFGEDVKTRNAIVFRRESAADPQRTQEAKVATGPLRRWTSRTRDRLFASVEFTALGSVDLGRGVPKVSGTDQAAVIETLNRQKHRLANMWVAADSCPPSDAFGCVGRPLIYVAGTAYNFLNVFRPHTYPRRSTREMSQSHLARFAAAEEASAERLFAILSSRLVFWWWHVHGDGFHVSRSFLAEIPFDNGSFTEVQCRQLSELGASLWYELQRYMIVSVNGGRETIAYRPLECDEIRASIDRVLIESAGISPAFVAHLGRFVRNVVVVDDADERRARLWTNASKPGVTQ